MRKLRDTRSLWAVRHRTVNVLDGDRSHFDYEPVGVVRLFKTRAEAREYVDSKYAYFKRPDLRAEPHGWRYPQAIRVNVTVGAL